MRTTVRTTGLLALAALLTATADAGVAVAEPGGGAPADQGDQAADALRWQEIPGAGAKATGVLARDGVLTLAAGHSREPGYYTFPARRLARAVNRIEVKLTADKPQGAAVEVRGVTPAGWWAEWQPLAEGRAVVAPFATDRIQVRVVLTRGAAVSGVALSADSAPAGTAPTVTMAAEAPTFRVPATREGLVGRTTANGHVIVPNDHFVALPSPRALNADDQTREYKVRVCNPRNGRCVEEPVWDVGPWNEKDDYWNPSNVREMWQDLPQGKPEATAAYYQGYNNGRDDRGRRVTNPSGIDLADGTWASLGMTGNDPVDVTYLWKAS